MHTVKYLIRGKRNVRYITRMLIYEVRTKTYILRQESVQNNGAGALHLKIATHLFPFSKYCTKLQEIAVEKYMRPPLKRYRIFFPIGARARKPTFHVYIYGCEFARKAV